MERARAGLLWHATPRPGLIGTLNAANNLNNGSHLRGSRMSTNQEMLHWREQTHKGLSHTPSDLDYWCSDVTWIASSGGGGWWVGGGGDVCVTRCYFLIPSTILKKNKKITRLTRFRWMLRKTKKYQNSSRLGINLLTSGWAAGFRTFTEFTHACKSLRTHTHTQRGLHTNTCTAEHKQHVFAFFSLSFFFLTGCMTSSSNLKIEPQIRPLGYTLHSTALKRAVYTLSLPVGIHNRLRNEKKK